jgi:hypothetical protein
MCPGVWWYRDPKRSPAAPARPATAPTPSAGAARAPAVPAPRADLAQAVAHAFTGRSKDPDAWLLMSLLVDSRVEMTDGAVSDGMTWLDAERLLAVALGNGQPLRLYNRFAREFGDGYSLRDDVPKDHQKRMNRLREAIATAPGVRGVVPRSPAPSPA